MNKENLAKVIQHIEDNPESWNQKSWCGTACCIAGHSQLLMGNESDEQTVRRDARVYLGIGSEEADYLFSGYRTLADFKQVLEEGFYDRDGYSRDGYDRDGYSRDGYSRAGYDRAGYDRDGLDRNNQMRP